MRSVLLRILCFLLCFMLLSGASTIRLRAGEIVVFAAASMKNALEETKDAFEKDSGHTAIFSFAGSSVLARQIDFGAPADVFVSASSDWMDVLEQTGRILQETRFDLAGNTLVLVAHEPQPAVSLASVADLSAQLKGGHLAMALTEAVPAGIYGKAALQHLGLWQTTAPHVAQADNVRAALALVATGAAPLGIVYGSDAVAEPRVHVLAEFEANNHPPIVYPVAAVAGRDSAATRAFLDYLRGTTAHNILMRHGFAAKAE